VTSCPPGRTDKAAPEQSGRRLVLSGVPGTRPVPHHPSVSAKGLTHR